MAFILNSTSFSPAITGFLTGLALIAPIGAQNTFILKLGLMRQHVLIIALLCGLMHAGLILVGVAFAGLTLGISGEVTNVMRYIGIGFLVFYGSYALFSAYKHSKPKPQALFAPAMGLKTAIITAMGLALLNPHVYLDTVVLIGGISLQYQPNQYEYALGALLASFIWFLSLGFGARLLSPFFSNPKSWAALEFCTGLLMLSIAYHIWLLP